MSLPQSLPAFTQEDYLAFERTAESRHEFLDGHVYAMAGESPEHSTICFNLAAAVGARLRGSDCRGFSPNMKVRTDPAGLFAYPDLAVVCGEPAFHDERRDVLTNPAVIFEVLSPSTEAYDRGEKFLRYRTQIDTLRDYLLVSQTRPMVEHFTRQADGSWRYATVAGLSASVHVESINCRLPLAEIYDRLPFPADEDRGAN